VRAGKDEDDGISKEDETSHETDSDKGVSSKNFTEKPPPEEEKHTNVEADPKENVYANKSDKDMVIVDDLVSNDTSLADREVESVAKRPRKQRKGNSY